MKPADSMHINLAGHAHTQNRRPYTANKHASVNMRMAANSLDVNTAYSSLYPVNNLLSCESMNFCTGMYEMRSSKSRSVFVLEAAVIGVATVSFGGLVDRAAYGR